MNKWNNENIKEEALKYTNRTEFQKQNSKAYRMAIRLGILDDVCEHMFKWTEEVVRKEALKYTNRTEFQKQNSKAYRAAIRLGILDDVCEHMLRFKKLNPKWTYDALKLEALKYTTINDFKNTNPSAYNIASDKKIIDDICSHMVRLGNLYNRFIYTIEFENNSIYIGLTYNLDTRKYQHIKNSSNKYVKEYINLGIGYKFISNEILYSVDDSIYMERNLIQEYRDKGYNVLNIAKGGSIGGSLIKWNLELVQEEALKFTSKSGFLKGSSKAYYAANRMGILNEVCSHMKKTVYWEYNKKKNKSL